MKRQLFVAVPVVIGLLLVVLGFQWSNVVPSSAYWTKEQAAELMEAQADLHSKIDKRTNSSSHQQSLEAAKDRFVKIQTQLDNARKSRGTTGWLLKILGILSVSAGVGFYFASKIA